MNFKENRKLINDAINSGCKTVAELALYIKIKEKSYLFKSVSKYKL